MAQCRPDSCITSHYRPLWAKAIADGEKLLRTKRLSPLQREAIEAERGIAKRSGGSEGRDLIQRREVAA